MAALLATIIHYGHAHGDLIQGFLAGVMFSCLIAGISDCFAVTKEIKTLREAKAPDSQER